MMLLRKKDQGIKKRAAQGCPQRHAANHIGARRRHLQRRNICHPNFVRGIHIARKVIAGRALRFLRNFSQGTIGWIFPTKDSWVHRMASGTLPPLSTINT